MKRLQLLLAVLFGCGLCSIGISSDSTTKDVEAALDAWQNRASARQSLMRISPQSQAALCSIALANDQTFLRRMRAISLLGTFGNAESVQTLEEISKTAPANLRCYAMHALSEIGTEEAWSILVAKLDDGSACMKSVSTDPASEEDVLVCDEAIRLLELKTGLSLAAEEDRDKRVKMWKTWWADRQKAAISR
jgi:HEAT repeat protein